MGKWVGKMELNVGPTVEMGLGYEYTVPRFIKEMGVVSLDFAI
ncbi:MAG: hypothetical protein HW380_2246 [Magnetococcales bacterium]|nr:hypothetical protein [Magnetococcales bacterium]